MPAAGIEKMQIGQRSDGRLPSASMRAASTSAPRGAGAHDGGRRRRDFSCCRRRRKSPCRRGAARLVSSIWFHRRRRDALSRAVATVREPLSRKAADDDAADIAKRRSAGALDHASSRSRDGRQPEKRRRRFRRCRVSYASSTPKLVVNSAMADGSHGETVSYRPIVQCFQHVMPQHLSRK